MYFELGCGLKACKTCGVWTSREASEGVEDDDDDGLFVLNDQENSLLYPPFPIPRPTSRRPPLTPLRDPATPRPPVRRPPLTPLRDPVTPFYDPQTPRPTGGRLRDPVTPHPGPHHVPGTAPKVAATPATVAAFRRQREALAQSLYRQCAPGLRPSSPYVALYCKILTSVGATRTHTPTHTCAHTHTHTHTHMHPHMCAHACTHVGRAVA